MASDSDATKTFLFTNIEGSTRLWERFPDAMRAATLRHSAIIAACVARRDGDLRRERGEGDSTFSVFADAADALAAEGEAMPLEEAVALALRV